jgi:hypothetical protein
MSELYTQTRAKRTDRRTPPVEQLDEHPPSRKPSNPFPSKLFFLAVGDELPPPISPSKPNLFGLGHGGF